MNYDSYESDDDNFDHSSTDLSSEDDPSDNDMISIPDDHSPEDGADRNDDTGNVVTGYKHKITGTKLIWQMG